MTDTSHGIGNMDKKATALQGAVSLLEHRLDTLRIEHDRVKADLQMIFRKFVTDKQFPIADRFRTWSKHCIKEHSSVAVRDGDFGLIGELATEEEGFFRRGVIYTWEYFLDIVTDHNEYPYEYDGNYQDVTVDDIKEVLIDVNFGSFTEEF